MNEQQQYSIVSMYHNFCIGLSINGHLDYHVLAIVKSAAMNIGVHVSLSIMVFSGYMPNSGIVGSIGSLFLELLLLLFLQIVF